MDAFSESKRNFTYSKFEYKSGQNEIEIVDEKDPAELKKLILRKEADWRKEKALLQQRLELCELEMNEGKIREQNLRKMNETIMATLNDLTNEENKTFSNKAMKELLQKLEEHSNSIINQKSKTTEAMRNLEIQNKSLRDKITEWEVKLRDVELHYEKTVMNQDHRIKELERETQRLNVNAAKLEEEKKKSLDLEKKLKSDESHSTLELIKKSHEEEIEFVRRESDRAINELREIYENDKRILESRLEKTQFMIKNYQNIIERQGYSGPVQAQSSYSIEQVEEERNIEQDRYEEELRREYEETIKRIKERERQEKKREESPKKQTRFEDNRSLTKISSDLGRHNQKEEEYLELRKYVDRLEESQQKLKNLLMEKDQMLEEERDKSKRMQQQPPQQQVPQQIPQQNFYKSEGSQRSQIFKTPNKSEAMNNGIRHATESDIYFKHRKDLGSDDLERTERGDKIEAEGTKKNNARRSPYLNEGDRTYTNHEEATNYREAYPYSYKEYLERSSEKKKRQDFFERDAEKNSRTELSTLIRCENCKSTFQPPEFMNHLMNCDSRQHMDSDAKYERELTTQIKRGKYRSDFSEEAARNEEYLQQHYSDEIYKILMNLNSEKGDIERRLREIENRLKLSETRNESLESEKEHLKEDLERIGDEMRKMKINSIFSEEKKEGYESTLKNEIKYLIGKLLKAKHKLVNHGQNSQNNSIIMNPNSNQNFNPGQSADLAKTNMSASSHHSRILNFSPVGESFNTHKRTASNLNYQDSDEDIPGQQNWREFREERREVITTSNKQQSQPRKAEVLFGARSKTPVKSRGEQDHGYRRNYDMDGEEYRYLTEKKSLHSGMDTQYDEEEDDLPRGYTTSGKIRNYRNILSSKIKMKNY